MCVLCSLVQPVCFASAYYYDVVCRDGGEILLVAFRLSEVKLFSLYFQDRVYLAPRLFEHPPLFAVNGGYFLIQGRRGLPVGWLKTGAAVLGSLNKKYPLFYCQGGKAGITRDYDWFKKKSGDMELFLQCGPALVWDGRINRSLSSAKAERSAVGVTRDNRVVFLLTNNVHISLRDAAQYLKDQGCSRAINLDGGCSSQGFLCADEVIWQSKGCFKIPVILVVEHK